MRISTQVYYQRGVDSVLSKQVTLSDQNQHLSSTKRVLTGEDDSVAIATIQRLNQNISVGEQYLENADAAEATNSLEDTALSQVTNILQRVRELVVAAGNETYGEANRESIATQLEGLREELIGVANTQDGSNEYIFAGFQGDTQPFQNNEFGEIDYHGDSGTRQYQVGSGVSVQGYDSGATVFTEIAEGNGTFVSEGGTNNTGGAVISEGSVFDEDAARDFVEQDYTISFSGSSATDDAQYAVYGLDDSAVTGDASITISQVDLTDANIATVNPSDIYPEAGSDVNVEFVATGNVDEFAIVINGVSSLPSVYDSSDTTTQEININGISVEIDGIPDAGDQYTLTKYIEPTTYEDGQSIEFNGIKTQIKGDVDQLDSFTLRQSGEKDIFAAIQDSIDSLRIPGDSGVAQAQRTMAIDNALLEVDNSMENVSNAHTAVGTRLNTIASQREATQDFNLTNQTTLSNLEDLDMAAAISEFQLQNSMLEVAQQTFVRLQSLSLFSLI